MPPIPNAARGTRAVEWTLRGTRRTCLERALVAQAWHGAAGVERDLVVGVRGPSREFVAHAWLDGEQFEEEGLVELTRYRYGRSAGEPPSDGARTTVVIPVWDEPYTSLLSEAIASVERQDCSVRVVVVDNASQTALPERREPRQSVVRSERRLSRGEARNLGLQRVETQFVLFLDADDLLLDGTIGRLQSELDATPSCVACAGSILEGEVGSSEAQGRHSVPRRFVPTLSRLRRIFTLATAIWPMYSTQGGTLIRTESIASHAYDDSDRGEDWVLGVSLAARGVKVIDRPGMLYRRHPASSRWAKATTDSYLWAGAARVRSRVRADSGAPAAIRRAGPLIWLGQVLVIGVLVPLRRRSGAAPSEQRPR